MCQLISILTGRTKIFVILASHWLSSACRLLHIIIDYVYYGYVLNHFNLVNILSAKGPKRKPHIQLGDTFCIQFCQFLSFLGRNQQAD